MYQEWIRQDFLCNVCVGQIFVQALYYLVQSIFFRHVLSLSKLARFFVSRSGLHLGEKVVVLSRQLLLENGLFAVVLPEGALDLFHY
jgi:hypothetical protein